MHHLYSTLCLLARLDEPGLFVDAAPDLREDGSASGVLSFARLLAGIAGISAEAVERRRKNIDTV